MYWHYGFPNMYTSSETMTNTFLHWQDFALNSTVVDPNIGFGVHIDGSDFSISGVYFGSLDIFNSVVCGVPLACSLECVADSRTMIDCTGASSQHSCSQLCPSTTSGLDHGPRISSDGRIRDNAIGASNRLQCS